MRKNQTIYSNKKEAFDYLNEQGEILKKALFKNDALVKTLQILEKSNLLNWYIGGGSIPQTFWNQYHGFDLNHGIDDFDIVYFDNKDPTKEVEEKNQKRIEKEYPNCPNKLEVVNEARTHIWYKKDFGREIEPYSCTEDAIYGFPTIASAIGVTLTNNKMKIFAPHGLTDLLSLTVRANKIAIPKWVYKKKCKRWKSVWPKLTIVPWEYKNN